jgi:tetratricopeptide (TPR) repeat protein
MVQMVFFLRFKSQLQRIRPELISYLENMAIRAVEEARGKITVKRSVIQAQFDENSLGFWLDILLLIEKIMQVMEEAAADLYGYSMLLGMPLPDLSGPLCRFLSGKSAGGGIFLDPPSARALQPYIVIDEQQRLAASSSKYGAETFSRVKDIKVFIPSAKASLPIWESSISLTRSGQRSAIIVVNQSFEGKRDKLYHRAATYANASNDGEFYPLFIRFGNGGLNALTDSMRHSKGPVVGEWEFLFRQRLNDAPSLFAIRTAHRFFESLLTLYSNFMRSREKTPVVILENIHAAEKAAGDIAIEILCKQSDLLLVGTCAGEPDFATIQKWKPLFPQLSETETEETFNQELPELPPELWEVGYACLLFGRYFPPDLFPRLFEEAGLSSIMFSRAISVLYTLRVIDTPLDPRPWHKNFQEQAENTLGDRKDGIRAMVRSRLLAWVAQKRINPCIRLLVILKELEAAKEIHNDLIIQSIQCELAGDNTFILEEACKGRTLENVAGINRTSALCYIVETSLALHSGKVNEINAVFAKPPPDCTAFPLLKVKTLLNQSLYHLGLRNNDSAADAVKEATLLCQGNSGPCLAQAYRLFALVSLLRRRIGETIDYLGFALESAAKSGDCQDIGMAAYYAASVQLLYGNLSRSRILAEKARRHFLKAGSAEWADRSRFLEGRLAFEIGSYQQAIDCFENIREYPDGDYSREKASLLEAWTYRARVCCKSPGVLKPLGDEYDIKLFELEALCLAEDYSRAADLSTMYAPPQSGEDFFRIEKPDWRSGFAQCELLYFSLADLGERMLSAYNSLAKSYLSSSGSQANGEEAVRTMQQILRSAQFPEIDPCDAFYHYTWYRVLKQTGADQVDIGTAVSVAFKQLQSRAARIDDIETRHCYLTQPYWNQVLGQAAREYKLV